MFPLTRQLLSVEQRLALVEPGILERIPDRADPYDRLLAEAYASVPSADLFAQISFAEARTYMHDVLLRDTDQMSMAHALEVRVPLLDHHLVDFVTGLPDRLKESNGGCRNGCSSNRSTACFPEASSTGPNRVSRCPSIHGCAVLSEVFVSGAWVNKGWPAVGS